MQESISRGEPIRFGPYEVDVAGGQLRKHGLRLPLQDLPFRILTLLLQRPGDVVSREDLRENLWPADVHVEYEHSLNSAIKKLRAALNDDPGRPRYIETIPRRGYRFIGTVEPPAPLAEDVPIAPVREPVRPRARLLAAVLGLLVVGAAIVLWPGSERRSDAPMRFSLPIEGEGQVRYASVSPDALRVAYITVGTDFAAVGPLWIQDLRRLEARKIADEALDVSWAPDGSALIYRRFGELVKVSVDGGSPAVIYPSDNKPMSHLSERWSGVNGTVLFGVGWPPSEIFEVSSAGGPPRKLELSGGGASTVTGPEYIVGAPSERLLLTEIRNGKSLIVAHDRKSGRRAVIAEGTNPLHSPGGHVLFLRGTSLRAIGFSAGSMKPSGEPFLVEQNVTHASVSHDGTLVYVDPGDQVQQLVWRDRQGNETGLIGQPQAQMKLPVLSPEGDRVLVAARENTEPDIWLHDVKRATKTRLTLNDVSDDRPLWHPDGKSFVFSSARRDGNMDIYRQSVEAVGEPESIVRSPAPEFPYTWSKQGALIFDRMAPALSDIWVSEPDEEGGRAESPLIKTEFDELSPQLSSDGRYLAYESNKSGRYEVYVTTFPARDREWQVSAKGGRSPRWRRDGRELYYVESGGKLFAVPIRTSPDFAPRDPIPLFTDHSLRERGHRYDVTADGKRFVLVKTIQRRPPVLRVVQNWIAGLDRADSPR